MKIYKIKFKNANNLMINLCFKVVFSILFLNVSLSAIAYQRIDKNFEVPIENTDSPSKEIPINLELKDQNLRSELCSKDQYIIERSVTPEYFLVKESTSDKALFYSKEPEKIISRVLSYSISEEIITIEMLEIGLHRKYIAPVSVVVQKAKYPPHKHNIAITALSLGTAVVWAGPAAIFGCTDTRPIKRIIEAAEATSTTDLKWISGTSTPKFSLSGFNQTYSVVLEKLGENIFKINLKDFLLKNSSVKDDSVISLNCTSCTILDSVESIPSQAKDTSVSFDLSGNFLSIQKKLLEQDKEQAARLLGYDSSNQFEVSNLFEPTASKAEVAQIYSLNLKSTQEISAEISRMNSLGYSSSQDVETFLNFLSDSLLARTQKIDVKLVRDKRILAVKVQKIKEEKERLMEEARQIKEQATIEKEEKDRLRRVALKQKQEYEKMQRERESLRPLREHYCSIFKQAENACAVAPNVSNCITIKLGFSNAHEYEAACYYINKRY